MMRSPRIQLAQNEVYKPRTAKMPVKRSIRWWSPYEFERETTPAVSIFFTQKALLNVCTFANIDMSNEVGGWLIGKIRKDKRTGEQFVVIENVLPAKHTREGSSFLTFTHNSQVALLNNLENYFPDKVLVGWFHTHPNMGIFFSGMDAWLHENFFRENWQIALVIEPVTSQGGFFIQRIDGTLDRHHYYGFFEILNKRRKSVMTWDNLDNEYYSMYQENNAATY